MPSTRPVAHARSRERRLPFRAPVRAWAQAEWVLLPLRAFLGVTFLYAGLQKLANPNFFNAQSPSSIQAQLIASVRISPVVVPAHAPGPVRQADRASSSRWPRSRSAPERSLGLWTRVAAIGGAVLSLSLFLTVSFHASPVLHRRRHRLLLRVAPADRRGRRVAHHGRRVDRPARREDGASPVADPGRDPLRRGAAALRALPVGTLQRARGPAVRRGGLPRPARPARAARAGAPSTRSTDARWCSAAPPRRRRRAPRRCSPRARPGSAARSDARRRRPRRPSSARPTTTTPGGTTPTTTPTSATGTLLGPAKDVPVGNAASFTIPASGDPGLVVQPTTGQFFAYDAVCPHAGCTVGYYASNHVIACPCHGSTFAVDTGAVLSGPAPRGLDQASHRRGVER